MTFHKLPTDTPCRFDIVDILDKITLIKNAFEGIIEKEAYYMTFINTDNAILNNTGKVPYIIFPQLSNIPL